MNISLSSLTMTSLLALSGLCLIALAWPLAWSSMAAISGDSIDRSIARRAPINGREIDTYYHSRREAVKRWPTPSHLADLSLALGLKASQVSPPDVAMLEQSLMTTLSVLRDRPGDAGAWVRAAAASVALNNPPEQAVSYLGMAFLTGVHSPRLRSAAAGVGLFVWDHLEAEDKRQVKRAMATAWREGKGQREPLLEDAITSGRVGVLELALSGHPSALHQMRRMNGAYNE